MTVGYSLHGINFEWDDEKAASNLSRHGISFETACETFFDPFLKVEDASVDEDEQRDANLGMTVDWRLLYVVFVMRGDEVIRLVSARKATPEERGKYESE
ncbi:MAG TPA: BrnT family toxin [Pyrinomonadaceae bacterium]|jgi:uncharacterized DUF497 family protein|nr:BrnT family toxin [Pyrinomonadaceae bacterium]